MSPVGLTRRNSIKPFELTVTMGQAKGITKLSKFGNSTTITPDSDPQDIWEFGGLYTFDDDGTAPIKYISSSDTDDSAQIIIAEGLDIDGNFVRQSIETTGQDNVVLPTPLWRLFRMYNDSVSGNDIVGTLYGHTDPVPTDGVPLDINVRAIIVGGANQTLMAIYTVPMGTVGFLFKGEVGLSTEGNINTLSEYARMHYESRRFGKVFTVKKLVTCLVSGSSIYQDMRSFQDAIPAKTDIRLRVIKVTDDMKVWGTFDVLLVDEGQLTPEFLDGIGQPGHE